ncbi:MAG: thiamine phosphate synthase [Proteobacteria bacterium]|nr:thiamine phosphate synthase [Pseudomonadota bacterium]
MTMAVTNCRIKGLYAIADSSSRPAASLPALARSFLEGGCGIVQLRMKDAGTRMMKAVAVEIMKLKAEYDFTFIVNDHVDLALEIGADGVHVGENDEPVESIKRRAPDLTVGYSSHSKDEAIAAAAAGADYMAFGAIYPTATKGPGHPVQGTGRLRELVQSAGAPVVAIGGIGRANVDDVLSTGVASVAMIGALANAADVAAETRWFVRKIRAAPPATI